MRRWKILYADSIYVKKLPFNLNFSSYADDIIKMSKTNSMKPNKQRISVRLPPLLFLLTLILDILSEFLIFIVWTWSLQNRGQKFVANAAQDKSLKVRRFMDTRSSLRQVSAQITKHLDAYYLCPVATFVLFYSRVGLGGVVVEESFFHLVCLSFDRELLLKRGQTSREISFLWHLRLLERLLLLQSTTELSTKAGFSTKAGLST